MRGCVSRSARASSLTGRSRPLRRTRIRRRCGSATALNASEVVAARAMNRNICPYRHMSRWRIARSRKTGGGCGMDLTNDSYVISISTKNFTERYYRDRTGWLKVSARGRKFRATAEQVLNHVLPAVAGLKPNVTIKVEHRAAT